jgi:hypothetical protein
MSINSPYVKPLRIVVAFVLAATFGARAEWVEQNARRENSAGAGLVHRHIELQNSSTQESAALELAIFPVKSHSLRVIDNRDGQAAAAEALPSAGCFAGVNGGYFDPNFAPLGLRIIDGKIMAPLIRARLLTGVLISSPGFTEILRVGEYSRRRNAYSAVQCGPLLVDADHAVKGLDRTRVARRTFALVGGDRAALGFCSEVSLAEMSQILGRARLEEGLKVQRALNLDGGSSSAFWFKRADGSAFSIPEQKNVRDFIGVSRRD